MIIIVLVLLTCLVECAENSRTLTLAAPKSQGILTHSFLQTIKELFNADVFIETGTRDGYSSATAAAIFRDVYTIELSEQLYKAAQTRHAEQRNITFLHGDSAQVLPQLLAVVQRQKIVLWLDGHFSEENTARGSCNTPILAEVQALKNSGITDAVVLIDDIRFFQKPLKDCSHTSVGGYPPLKELVRLFKNIHPAYRCAVIGDIAVFYRKSENMQLSPALKALTVSRLSSQLSSRHSVIKKLITQATQEEREHINGLYTLFGTEFYGLVFGFNRYFYYWQSLITDDKKEAARLLEFARSQGLVF